MASGGSRNCACSARMFWSIRLSLMTYRWTSGERGVPVADATQRDHELQQVGVGLLPERFLGPPEEVVQQRSQGIGHGVRVEIVVQRVVAEPGVEADLQVVVATSSLGRGCPRTCLQKSPFTSRTSPPTFRSVSSATASAAAGRRMGTCRRTSFRCRRRRGSSRRCRGRAPGMVSHVGVGARPGVAGSASHPGQGLAQVVRSRRAGRGQGAHPLRGFTPVDRDRGDGQRQRGDEERAAKPQSGVAVGQPDEQRSASEARPVPGTGCRATWGYAVRPHTPTAVATSIATSPRISMPLAHHRLATSLSSRMPQRGAAVPWPDSVITGCRATCAGRPSPCSAVNEVCADPGWRPARPGTRLSCARSVSIT